MSNVRVCVTQEGQEIIIKGAVNDDFVLDICQKIDGSGFDMTIIDDIDTKERFECLRRTIKMYERIFEID